MMPISDKVVGVAQNQQLTNAVSGNGNRAALLVATQRNNAAIDPKLFMYLVFASLISITFEVIKYF